MARVGSPLQQIFLRFAPKYTAKFGDRIPLTHRRALFDITACRTEVMKILGSDSDISLQDLCYQYVNYFKIK